MKSCQLALVSLLLPLLHLCAAAADAAEPAGEATARGEPIFREDFERCTPRDKVLFDESRQGFWNLRCKTWGDNNLLHGGPGTPDITYDPALNGVYDIEVESRATDRPGGFGLKLASESEFTLLEVPNEGATANKHFNVWVPFRKSVRLDGEKLVFRCTDKAAYIDALKFIPVSRFKKFRPLTKNEPGPASGVICSSRAGTSAGLYRLSGHPGRTDGDFFGRSPTSALGQDPRVRSRDNGKTCPTLSPSTIRRRTTGTRVS